MTLRKKVALVFPPGLEMPGQISAFIVESLSPDQAREVSCAEITNQFQFTPPVPFQGFFQGFLVIETTRSVDVTATYSAGPATGGAVAAPAAPSTSLTVATVDVERIHERKISREEDDDKDKDKDKDKEGDKEDKR